MFTFTTKIPDDFDWTNQTEFTNKVHLTYTDAVLGNQSQDGEATWKDENKQGVVITKKAVPDGTKNSIAYEVGVDGTITVENLKKDWIYALYETKAKDGYARRTDPYYFIIDDDDSVTLPSGITIEKFVNDENVLEYENQLEAVLYITKTVENEDWDNVKNDITFTVKKGDLVIATVNGADMTKNGGVYVAAINQLEAKTGQEATGIILLADSYNTVAFTNTYEEKTGGLEIIKRVHGDLNWEQVKNTISFKITDEDGNEIPGSPVAGTAFAETAPDSGIYYYEINGLTVGKTYTVTEVLTGEDEAYSRTTTYIAATRGTGEMAVSVPVQDSMYSVVTFDNTYTKKTGKIVITKTVLGNVDKAKAEAAISFKVTRTANGTSKTYKLSDFTYDTAGKIWTLELDAAPGGYQVEETRNAVGGLTLKKVQYEVDGSGKVDGSLAFMHVSDGTSAKVAYENTYEKKTPTTPPSPWPSEPTPTDQGTPDTGDNGNLALWVILFVVSGMGLGLAVLAVLDKKNKKK